MAASLFNWRSVRAWGWLVCLAMAPALCPAKEDTPPRGLDYPKDLRAVRAKSVQTDGLFAADIAFALRTCPQCGKPYVFGTFPRLKRLPFDNLAAVHQTVATVCLRRAPSKTMYSPQQQIYVPRACPACGEPEGDGRADKVLFCHLIPESGDDVQIEYEIRDGKLSATKTWWRVPKNGAAVKVDMREETEESFKQAYGQYFSLRAVWNEIIAASERENLFSAQEPQIPYRQVAPGMWFILRPRNVNDEQFKAFGEKRLKADRDKGLYSWLDSPLKAGPNLSTAEGTYKDWAAQYETMLTSGAVECFVGVSYPELHAAARAVLASRNIEIEVTPGQKKSDAGQGLLKKGELHIEIQFAPLASQAVFSGLSLHHACAFYLTRPVFVLEKACLLNVLFRRPLPECSFEVTTGQFLIARDSKKQERKFNLLALAEHLDPDDSDMLNMFFEDVVKWDAKLHCFGPPPNPRDVAPTGLPAFIERRVRPAGFLKGRGLADALYEPREDKDGKAYDLCYTSECSASLVYLDPAKERFKGLTLQEAQRLYDLRPGILPMAVDAEDSLFFPGDRNVMKFTPGKVMLLCGRDLAALGADRERAAGLAALAGIAATSYETLHFYAATSNAVALATRALAPEERTLSQNRLRSLLAESGLEPGFELNLHFDLPKADPRGKVFRRGK